MALTDLLSAREREEVFARMVLGLGRPDFTGFPITDWHSGGVTLTLAMIAAEAIADAERRVEQIGYGGYLQTAGDEWLDEVVQSQYGLTRQEATFARGIVTFTAAAGSGGLTLPGGTLLATISGRQYATLEPVELLVGGTVTTNIQALEPGSLPNVGRGSISKMLSPIPGVSVTNPEGWLTSAGADRETDEALRLRARLQWSSLGGGMTRSAYEYAALTASPAVQQVLVLDEHPRGQGTLDVIVWGAGGIGPADVEAVNAVVQARRPVTANALVYAAQEREVSVTLRLYAPLLSLAERGRVELEVLAALERLARETPIGGILYHAQIIEVAMSPPGVLDATRTGLNVDVRLGLIEGLTLVPTIEWRSQA